MLIYKGGLVIRKNTFKKIKKEKLPILSVGKRRRQKKRRIIISSILGLLILPWMVLILFRNPIVENIAEKGLTTIFESPVEITDLHIGIFKPGFSIQKMTIDDTYSKSDYLLKTGLIRISYHIIPLFRENLVSIPEIIFDNIRFNEPMTEKEIKRSKKARAKLAKKNAKKSKKKENSSPTKPPFISKNILDSLVQSIEIEPLIQQYTIIKQVKMLNKNIGILESDGIKTLEKSTKTTTNIQKEYNSVSNNLKNTTTINALQTNIQKITPLLAQSRNTLYTVQQIKTDAEKYTGQIKTYSKNISASIQNDTDKILSHIADPRALGNKILLDILEHIIKEKAGNFTNVAFSILDGFEKMLKTYKNKEKTSADTVKNNKKAKKSMNFRIGLFQFSVGMGIIKKPLFVVSGKNITDRIYTSPEPTEFYIQIGEGRHFTFKGQGGISFHPEAPMFLQTHLSYEGLPFILTNDALEIVEMRSVAGTADGTINIALKDKHSGIIESKITSYDLDIQAKDGAAFGPKIGEGLEQASPLFVSTSVTLEERAIKDIAMTNNFVSKITDIAAQIIQAHLVTLTEEMKSQIESEVRKQVESQLGISEGTLADFTKNIDTAYARIEKVNKKVNALFSETNEKVRSVAREQAKKVANEAKEKARETAKKASEEAVNNIKKSLPSF